MTRDKWGTPMTGFKVPLLGAIMGGLAILCFIVAAVLPGILDRKIPELPAPVEVVRPAPQPYTLPLAYAQWVIRYCDETGVPVWLACRLFAWESGWRAGYVSVENVNGTRDSGSPPSTPRASTRSARSTMGRVSTRTTPRPPSA